MRKRDLWNCWLVGTWEMPSVSLFWITPSLLNSGHLCSECGCVHYFRLERGLKRVRR